jgi:hypothetical protein
MFGLAGSAADRPSTIQQASSRQRGGMDAT